MLKVFELNLLFRIVMNNDSKKSIWFFQKKPAGFSSRNLKWERTHGGLKFGIKV